MIKCTVCNEELVREVIPRLNVPIATIESENSVIVGNTIDFYVVVSGGSTIKGLAVVPQFDTDVFEYVSGEWVIGGAFIQNVDLQTMTAVSAWTDPVDPNGRIYKFTLRSKVLATNTVVSAEVRMDDEAGPVSMSIVAKTLDVIECPHANGSYVEIDEHYHSFICADCGYGTIMEHRYDGANDFYCDDCGYLSCVLGDFDGDGDVDSDDAVYLLSAVFYPDTYILNQPGDMDGDGDLDSDDAVYLLYYTFYGDVYYPISH